MRKLRKLTKKPLKPGGGGGPARGMQPNTRRDFFVSLYRFETKPLPSPCRVVFASTGITSSTTQVVGDVAKKRAENAKWYADLEKKYDVVFAKAQAAIAKGDWQEVGRLADENHALLQQLGVSCKELDDLVSDARQAGAAGAKLAGTGRGGLMFAVCKDEASQQKVFQALSRRAPQAWKTSFL